MTIFISAVSFTFAVYWFERLHDVARSQWQRYAIDAVIVVLVFVYARWMP